MEKREQDVLDQIRKETQDIKVPDELRPEKIEEMLKERGTKKRGPGRRVYQIGALAAACLALVAGAAALKTAEPSAGGTDRESAVSSETETADAEADTAEEKGGSMAGGAKSASAESGAAVKEPLVRKEDADPDDYKEIYAFLKKQEDQVTARAELQKESMISMEDSAELATEISSDTSASAGASAAGTGMDTGASAADYSQTNVRQEGVDEADIVKTDGRYLYVLKNNTRRIGIVDTKGGLQAVGSIQAEKKESIREFYVQPEQKRLILISCRESGSARSTTTEAVTYSISDPAHPKELGRVTQSGWADTSRVSGDYLYLFTEYIVPGGFEREHPDTYVPVINGGLVRSKDIYLPPFENGSSYEVITAVNLNEPSKAADSKAVFSEGGQLYVSGENIYYYVTRWDDDGESAKTSIHRIGYKNGKFSKAVQEKIDGYINDSFSIDEYNGYLRVVATTGETNAVYVMDGKLKVVGSIEGLAKDERVYSARFLGDTGYFVTYRETDPLFSVDLSDPEKPEILGRLKIPGFSEYLHFYGKDKLLGIGMDVDEDTQATNGVKISMFDISDNTDVKEEYKTVLKNVYGTDVSYDYKGVLIDAARNLIGFSAYAEGGERYFLYSYDEKDGFACRLNREINGSSLLPCRGVCIGDILYVVRGNIIEAYSLETYRKVDDIIL